MLALQANIIICVGLLFVSRSDFTSKYIDGTNWFMTSCAGWSPWGRMNQYRIINNVCEMTMGSDGGPWGVASAVWYVYNSIYIYIHK